MPTPDAPSSDNPYISYHCLRLTSEAAIIGNGAHVDPIAEKIELGYPPRDAIALGLLAMGFEKDDYDTPRIAGVLSDRAMVGTVRRDALQVREVHEPTLLATYEEDDPTPIEVEWESAESAARGSFELPYEHPICAAAVATTNDGFETAVYNGPEAED